MRHTSLVLAALATLALSAAPALAASRVVTKKAAAVTPIKTTFGKPSSGFAGTAKPAAAAQVKFAPVVRGGGIVAAGGGN